MLAYGNIKYYIKNLRLNHSISLCKLYCTKIFFVLYQVILSSMIKECEQKVENKTVQEPQG